jgi:poly(hydroxyalkanoate) granule-associated protein
MEKKRLKALASENDEKFADAVLASAQQIWQAGLGAFSIAEDEGGKLFSKLVKEGSEMQKRTRRLAEVRVSGVTDSVTKMADSVSKQASGSWDKIEQVFEDRVSRALAGMGVPTNKDILALTKRIENLSEAVQSLSETKISPRSAPTKSVKKPSPAVETASRTSARKAPSGSVKPKKTPIQKSRSKKIPGATAGTST